MAKNIWLLFVGIAMGGICLCIGLLDTHRHAAMVGLVACLAFFMDAANGANFAVLPHVFPHANGMLIFPESSRIAHKAMLTSLGLQVYYPELSEQRETLAESSLPSYSVTTARITGGQSGLQAS